MYLHQMAKPRYRWRLLPALAVVVSAACGRSKPLPIDPPDATVEGVSLLSSHLVVGISDYDGEYRLFLDLLTIFDGPSAGILGEAWADSGYARLQEEGTILELAVEATDEREAQTGLPIFDYAQTTASPTLDCEIRVDGQAVPYVIPGWEDDPEYGLTGRMVTDCLGDGVEMLTGIFYDNEGELVGNIIGDFGFEEEPPDNVEVAAGGARRRSLP